MFLKPNIKPFHLFNSDGDPHTQFIKQSTILRFLEIPYTSTLEGTLTRINTVFREISFVKEVWHIKRRHVGCLLLLDVPPPARPAIYDGLFPNRTLSHLKPYRLTEGYYLLCLNLYLEN